MNMPVHVSMHTLTFAAPIQVPTAPACQEQGLKRLKVALSCDSSGSYMAKHVMPFLSVLGDECLAKGTCRCVGKVN